MSFKMGLGFAAQDGDDAWTTAAVERTGFERGGANILLIILFLALRTGLAFVARRLWAAAFCLSAAAFVFMIQVHI